jgi:hypothetical protein
MCGDYFCYQWFASENGSDNDGCFGSGGSVPELDPTGVKHDGIYNGGRPCYNHRTLVNLLNDGEITWRYYARQKKSLWTAPNAIHDICLPDDNGECQGDDWINNVKNVLPDQGDYSSAPILDDIENCNLQQVSWVIPDGNWSDHAGGDRYTGSADAGPSWVAAIVNAIGNSWTNSDHQCDYWGGNGFAGEEPTVILITWDDWGGYYDDVVPPNCSGPDQCSGYSNETGGQYVYGFRVPLLVVGAYVQQVTSQGGYISGANALDPVHPDCANNTYCHDFGSILNFIEYAFGTDDAPLGGLGGISPDYKYADALVMDKETTPPNNYSLYDFFDFTQDPPRTFETINGAKYPSICFQYAGVCNPTYPLEPDNDAHEVE